VSRERGGLRYRFGLTALQSFSEVMRTGSATGAGRALGLSQPEISRVISQFEKEIGFELFYRDKSKLIPTKDALALAEEVELALAGIERIRGLARDIATHAVGEIRVVAPPSFAEGILPGIVSSFMHKFPSVRVTIDSRSVPTMKTMLATRIVDCAFMRLPIDRSDLSAEVMVRSGSVCMLHKAHPLASRETIGPKDLDGAALVSLGINTAHGRQLEDMFRSAKVRQRIVVECHTTSAACALARQGIGIAIVNELLARAYLHAPLVMRPFKPALIHEYALVTSARSQPSRLLVEFRESALRYLAKSA
jgi:DNA-binding transcriptional LysR family regulator